MKRSAFVFAALLFTAMVLTAGCTTNTSNPTATPKPDYSADFERILYRAAYERILNGDADVTIINPMSQLSDGVYSGSYNLTDVNGTYTYDVKIEVAQSETAAKARYEELVLQKQDAGYTSRSTGLGSSTIFGETKASWAGTKLSSSFEVIYADNPETGEWVVVSVDTFSQH